MSTMEQHLSLINRHVNTVKDVPALEFIEVFANHLYMRKKTGVNGLRKHYGTKMRRGTKSEHNRKAGGKNIRYALLMLENAGLVGTSRLYSQDGQTITMGKALTKKGTMDMDRIAAQTIKKK